jgi:hypothetical protein
MQDTSLSGQSWAHPSLPSSQSTLFSQQKSSTPLPFTLSDDTHYHTWAFLMTQRLKANDSWDTANKVPLETGFSMDFIVNNIHPNLVPQIMHYSKAADVWNFLKEGFAGASRAHQVSGFHELSNYTIDATNTAKAVFDFEQMYLRHLSSKSTIPGD